MPTYRLMTPATAATDIPAIAALYELARPGLVANGYTELGPLTQAYLMFNMNRTREKVALAFDDGGTLRGFIELIFSKTTEKLCIWNLYAIDPRISLASVRTHRDEICRRIIQQIPNGYTVQVPSVAPSATIAREYLLAKFGAPVTEPSGRLRYSKSIEALRLVA